MASDTDSLRPPTPAFWRVATVIATGLFVTGLGWPGLIGRLPFGLLLKNQLQLPPEEVAAFWAVATAAWYVKPLFGLLCDAWPLFGTRRRGYLLLGSAAASSAWMAFALVPRTFGSLMVVMTLLNLALVVVSASVGGLLVEEGQRRGATGRLSAMRTALEGVMSLVAGPLAGVLASRAFGVTAATGAATLLVLIPVTLLLYHEPQRAVANHAVWARAAGDLRAIGRSRAMWTTALLLFLVYVSPGLQTPLLYYQQDVLQLGPQMMGWLQTAGGVGVLVGAALYAWLCRRLPLRLTLIGGIVLNAAAALLYLGYRSATSALVIDGLVGFLGAMGTLPLYDLAARATPKGSESFGFALLMSVRTLSQFGLSDPLGSYLYGRLQVGFATLILINAGSTLAVLLFLPFLPAALLARREGAIAPGA